MRKRPERLAYAELLEYGVRALTRRAMSVAELRQRLGPRASEAADVDRVVRELTSAGALDDRRFAERYAAYRVENQRFGKTRVLRDLAAKRVSRPVADSAVAEVFAEVDEMELIDSFIARKFRGVDLPEYLAEEKNLAAAYRKLRLAGFSTSNSVRALKRYSVRAEELEDIDEGGDAEQPPPTSEY